MKIIAALLLVALTALGARAHDFYPIECCSSMDCAVVDKVEMVQSFSAGLLGSPAFAAPGMSSMVVTTKHGTVVVPANFPRRQSPDGNMHACMRPTGEGMQLLCLFLPPAS